MSYFSYRHTSYRTYERIRKPLLPLPKSCHSGRCRQRSSCCTTQQESNSPMAGPSDFQGKVAIVTGATSGIGFEAAAELCRRGGEVVFGVRNLEKAKQCAAEITRRHPGARILVPDVPLDFESQASVQQFARWFLNLKKPIHILINNAGTSQIPEKHTGDNVGILAQNNYLGPYTLTRLLEHNLVASKTRIVNVSSITHRAADIKDPHSFLRETKQGQYAHTKLANVLFAYETQRRLGGYGVESCAADPGAVRTGIWGHTQMLSKPPFSWVINGLYAPPEDGAKTIVDAATMDWKLHRNPAVHPSKDLRFYAKGLFASPLVVQVDGCNGGLVAMLWASSALVHSMLDYPIRGLSHGALGSKTVLVPSSQPSYDEKLAADLWDLSAHVAGLEVEPLSPPSVRKANK